MMFQKTHVQKFLKEGLKNEHKINKIQLFDRNYKKCSSNMTRSQLIKNENSPLLPIKVISPEKTKKKDITLDSTIGKTKIVNDLLNSEDGIKTNRKVHMSENIKNIVLSNLTLQEQNDKDRKIFPSAQSSKLTKFQKTVKLFEEIK